MPDKMIRVTQWESYQTSLPKHQYGCRTFSGKSASEKVQKTCAHFVGMWIE